MKVTLIDVFGFEKIEDREEPLPSEIHARFTDTRRYMIAGLPPGMPLESHDLVFRRDWLADRPTYRMNLNSAREALSK